MKFFFPGYLPMLQHAQDGRGAAPIYRPSLQDDAQCSIVMARCDTCLFYLVQPCGATHRCALLSACVSVACMQLRVRLYLCWSRSATSEKE